MEWIQALDALGIGVVAVSGGASQARNERARALLEGLHGEHIREALQRFERAGPAEGAGVLRVEGVGPLSIARVDPDPGLLLLGVDETRQASEESQVWQRLLSVLSADEGTQADLERLLSILVVSGGLQQVALFVNEPGSGVWVCRAQAEQPGPVRLRLIPRPAQPQVSVVSAAGLSRRPILFPRASRSPYPMEALPLGGSDLSVIALPVEGPGDPVLLLAESPERWGTLGLRLAHAAGWVMGHLLQRRRVEAQRQRERHAWEQMLEASPDAVLEAGGDGRIRAAHGQLQAVLGMEAAGLEQTPLVHVVHPEDRELFAQLLSEADPLQVQRQVVRVIRPDGEGICEVVAYPVEGPDRHPAIRAVFRDVRAQRELERKLAQAQEVVARRERLATLGQLAAGVAHEINNPLAFIKSNLGEIDRSLQELRAEPGRPAPPETLSELEEIVFESRSGIERIGAIVRALKGAARGGEERTRFRPGDALKEAVTIFRGAHRATAEIQLEVEGSAPVIGTPGALIQIALNLLENGLDAMGGRGRLEVEVRDVAGNVRLRFKDAGPGIPAELADTVFEPFFTTKPAGHGTGLGLFICRELARKMGGEIWFDSAPEGTCFTVLLPVAGEEAQGGPS